MKILYFSVHAILEYDEIRMFQSLGHSVFTLGAYFSGRASQPFRPEIGFDPATMHEMMDLFRRAGGEYRPGRPWDQSIIPAEFVDQFDVCVVMHEPEFIKAHWPTLSRIPVVWRSIGVDIEGCEAVMRPYREQGCAIVRYSPRERLARDYIGEDAIIRFPKRLSDFHPRHRQNDRILLFANNFQARYPAESAIFLDAVEGHDFAVGGMGNEGFPGAIGTASYDEQLAHLATNGAYFYCAGTSIPYTLNFMEAWLAGIPVVVLDPRALHAEAQAKFAEIPALIDHGVNGFVVRDARHARDVFKALRRDEELAERIGQAGAAKAVAMFGEDRVAADWQAVLSGLSR